MAGAATIGWIRFWVSEEVSVRVAAGVAQVLGEGNRVQSVGNGDTDNGEMVTHIVCLPAAYERLRGYEKMVGDKFDVRRSALPSDIGCDDDRLQGVHLVTPLWAVRSAAQGRWHPEVCRCCVLYAGKFLLFVRCFTRIDSLQEAYSPDPAKFFSGLVVYFDDYPVRQFAFTNATAAAVDGLLHCLLARDRRTSRWCTARSSRTTAGKSPSS